jgi:hypothetical protein
LQPWGSACGGVEVDARFPSWRQARPLSTRAVVGSRRRNCVEVQLSGPRTLCAYVGPWARGRLLQQAPCGGGGDPPNRHQQGLGNGAALRPGRIVRRVGYPRVTAGTAKTSKATIIRGSGELSCSERQVRGDRRYGAEAPLQPWGSACGGAGGCQPTATGTTAPQTCQPASARLYSACMECVAHACARGDQVSRGAQDASIRGVSATSHPPVGAQ